MNCLYSLAREDSGSCVTEWIEERKVTRSKRLFVQHTNLHKRNMMSLFFSRPALSVKIFLNRKNCRHYSAVHILAY